jgi:hypothetical protein
MAEIMISSTPHSGEKIAAPNSQADQHTRQPK